MEEDGFRSSGKSSGAVPGGGVFTGSGSGREDGEDGEDGED
ncbi:hypothetical protein HMPREF3038_00020, partial [Akkermansia sp. KLE1797]